MPLPQATLHGAAGIAVPTLVSTLAISCVFTSVVFLDGPAKYLFTPLGLAVVFAMLASYGLSRTLTPDHHRPAAQGRASWPPRSGGSERLVLPRSPPLSSAASSGMRRRLRRAPRRSLLRRRVHRSDRRRPDARRSAPAMLAAGRPRLLSGHRRRPDPAARARARRNPHRNHRARSSRRSRTRSARSSPSSERATDRRQYRVAGARLQSRIRRRLDDRRQRRRDPGGAQGRPCADRRLRRASCAQALPAAFPEVTFYFQAADIVTQILNFGLPAQIDVRTVGYDRATTCASPRSSGGASPQFPVSSTRICSRRSTPRPSIADDRSHARRAARPQRQRHRHQRQRQPELVRAGLAQFLDRSDIGNSLLHRGPDAGAQRELAERSRQHAGLDRDDRLAAEHRCPGCSATSRRSSATACRPTRTRPTSSRSTRSTPAFRAAISAASSGEISKIVAESAEAALARQLDSGRRPDPEHERCLPRISASACCSPPCSSTC